MGNGAHQMTFHGALDILTVVASFGLIIWLFIKFHDDLK
jgi:hypothetical protein